MFPVRNKVNGKRHKLVTLICVVCKVDGVATPNSQITFDVLGLSHNVIMGITCWVVSRKSGNFDDSVENAVLAAEIRMTIGTVFSKTHFD